MTTNNKAVTCYLPKDIEDFITGYSLQYGITRKDKEGETLPSLGTGIIELLKLLAYNPELVSSPILDTVPSKFSEDAIEKKIDEILEKKLNSPDTVPSQVTDLEGKVESIILDKLPSIIPEYLPSDLLARIENMERLLRLQQSASIASHSPDEPAIVPPNEPNAIEPAIETVTPEVSPSPPSPLGTDAIEDSEKKIMESVGEPDSIDTLAAGGTSPTDDQNAIESDPANPPVTEAIEPAIEDEDKPWLTLEELLSCDYQDWPTSIEGLRVKAKREAWTKRKRGKAYEYQAKLPHHE